MDLIANVTETQVARTAVGAHQPYPDASLLKPLLNSLARVRVYWSATAAAASSPTVLSPVKGDIVKNSVVVSAATTGTAVIAVTPAGGSAVAALAGTLSGTAVNAFVVKTTDPDVSANSIVIKDQAILIGIATATAGTLFGYLEIQPRE